MTVIVIFTYLKSIAVQSYEFSSAEKAERFAGQIAFKLYEFSPKIFMVDKNSGHVKSKDEDASSTVLTVKE